MKTFSISWFVPSALIGFIFGSVLALNAGQVRAHEGDQSVFAESSGLSEVSRPFKAGRWGVSYENDFFVLGGRDQDYTYGMSINYSSENLSSSSLNTPLNKIDSVLGFASGDYSRYSFEGGFYGFTPEDITVAEPNHDDRPFAGLVYFSTSKERVNLAERSVLKTQLSYGVLGLEIVGDIQDETHKLIGNDLPKGWDNQVSNGGEFTLRYSVSKQNLLISNSNNFELRQTTGLSLGYLTEASWGLSFRAGKLNSSWHNFKPEMASYAEASASTNRASSESFFWGGIALKARAYNAFLQGQFRDSAVTYKASELNHGIIEVWAGYTHSFVNGYYVSYGLRGHTSEVKSGAANRQVIWGGMMIGKKFS